MKLELETEDIVKYSLIGIFAAVAVYFWPSYQKAIPLNNDPGKSGLAEIADISTQAPLSLITEPDQGVAPIIEAIHNAGKSVDLVIYNLSDQNVEDALVEAETHGITVRVIMDNSSHFGRQPNQSAYDYLSAHGVAVMWAKNYFPLTHQKTLVIDNTRAIIMTFNLTPKYYASSRDFAIVDDNTSDIKAIEAAFDWDWQGIKRTAENGDDLVWSPGSFGTLLALINSASSSLDIYNEEMADERITQTLEKAAARGVKVRIAMTYATQWKQAFLELVAAGADIKTYASTAPFYIHAKVIIADSAKAFVGSENFSRQSLDANRELGILISRPEIISSLENTFNADRASARPFPLKTSKK